MMKKTISALELEVACISRIYVYLANSGAKLYTADISTTNHVSGYFRSPCTSEQYKNKYCFLKHPD